MQIVLRMLSTLSLLPTSVRQINANVSRICRTDKQKEWCTTIMCIMMSRNLLLGRNSDLKECQGLFTSCTPINYWSSFLGPHCLGHFISNVYKQLVMWWRLMLQQQNLFRGVLSNVVAMTKGLIVGCFDHESPSATKTFCT